MTANMAHASSQLDNTVRGCHDINETYLDTAAPGGGSVGSWSRQLFVKADGTR